MRRFAPFAIAALAAIIFTARPTYDPDLFWHLPHGRRVPAGPTVPHTPFTPTLASAPPAT
mgnify:CR=1 FL=1